MNKDHRKQIIKEMNRDAIIDAAESLIVLHPKGIDGVTMDDIAKKADFTKRTIYQYFISKEEIHFAIMIRSHHIMLRYLQESLHDHQTGIERLQATGKALYKYSLDDPLHFWTIMAYENQESDFNLVDENLKKEAFLVGEESMKILIHTIKLGKEDQTMSPDLNEVDTAFAVWSFLLGMLNTLKTKKNYMIHAYSIDLNQWIENAFTLIINTLRKEKL